MLDYNINYNLLSKWNYKNSEKNQCKNNYFLMENKKINCDNKLCLNVNCESCFLKLKNNINLDLDNINSLNANNNLSNLNKNYIKSNENNNEKNNEIINEFFYKEERKELRRLANCLFFKEL